MKWPLPSVQTVIIKSYSVNVLSARVITYILKSLRAMIFLQNRTLNNVYFSSFRNFFGLVVIERFPSAVAKS